MAPPKLYKFCDDVGRDTIEWRMLLQNHSLGTILSFNISPLGRLVLFLHCDIAIQEIHEEDGFVFKNEWKGNLVNFLIFLQSNKSNIYTYISIKSSNQMLNKKYFIISSSKILFIDHPKLQIEICLWCFVEQYKYCYGDGPCTLWQMANEVCVCVCVWDHYKKQFMSDYISKKYYHNIVKIVMS